MTIQKFGWQLGLVTAFCICLSWCLGASFAVLGQHLLAAWWAIVLFVVLSVLMFVLGNIAAKAINKKLFSQLTIFFTFTKLLCSVGSIVLYKFKIQPSDKWFVIPFLLVYLIFTIFETYFMFQLSQIPNEK
jgi:hypothetical protein